MLLSREGIDDADKLNDVHKAALDKWKTTNSPFLWY